MRYVVVWTGQFCQAIPLIPKFVKSIQDTASSLKDLQTRKPAHSIVTKYKHTGVWSLAVEQITRGDQVFCLNLHLQIQTKDLHISRLCTYNEN